MVGRRSHAGFSVGGPELAFLLLAMRGRAGGLGSRARAWVEEAELVSVL